jgi:hypothetical protein
MERYFALLWIPPSLPRPRRFKYVSLFLTLYIYIAFHPAWFLYILILLPNFRAARLCPLGTLHLPRFLKIMPRLLAWAFIPRICIDREARTQTWPIYLRDWVKVYIIFLHTIVNRNSARSSGLGGFNILRKLNLLNVNLNGIPWNSATILWKLLVQEIAAACIAHLWCSRVTISCCLIPYCVQNMWNIVLRDI